MNIVIINKSDLQGGAAIAANRLKNALAKSGIQVSMLVQKKASNDSSVYISRKGKAGKYAEFLFFVLERLYFWFYEKSKAVRFAFSPAIAGENISKHHLVKNADIIHLHWFNQGYLSLKTLKKLLSPGKPVVWTLHDMWAFTGGCHYSGDCENYKTACGHCKFLKTPGANDLSNEIWQKKKKMLEKSDIYFVTCSEWLANRARESSLLKNAKIVSIPNPIDTSLYYPRNKQRARENLKLPINRKLILFGAANIMDERKGLNYLLLALKKLKEENSALAETIDVVLFGKSDPEFISRIPFRIHDLGLISNVLDIIEIYSAADLFVLPSLEDNLPNTIMESMACGTPVVAFKTGGIPEMLDHKINGYLAQYKSVEDLKKGIEFSLLNFDKEDNIKEISARVAENYNEQKISQKYLELYLKSIESKK
jgi:glycosyltransferase involved in cell wall biosynthesis